MENKIINYIMKEDKIPYLMKNTYTFKKINKFINWIIKKLLKWNVIEEYNDYKTTIRRAEISTDKIFDLIKDQLNFMRMRGENPTKAILGFKQMQKLEVECYSILNFYTNIMYFDNGLQKVLNLEVTLNPYIDGVVIV
jgi:hypothetical protein